MFVLGAEAVLHDLSVRMHEMQDRWKRDLARGDRQVKRAPGRAGGVKKMEDEEKGKKGRRRA